MEAQASVMQLSTFTMVRFIPSEKNYMDFPVTVRVKAPVVTVHQHAPVDIVAVIDVSKSMSWDRKPRIPVPDHSRLNVVKKAMAKVIKNLGAHGSENRLAVVTFNEKVKVVTDLEAMTEEGQRSVTKMVDAMEPEGMTNFSRPLRKAAEILDSREKKDSLAFIIFISDGEDMGFLVKEIPQAYPIHAFGISKDHKAAALEAMADVTSGSYTPITQDLDKITEKLDQLSDKLSSLVAVDMGIHLKTLHPGVSLLRIEPSATNDSSKIEIDADKQSAQILVGAVSSGMESEFTVYLYVPEGQGNGAEGAMDLLTIGGTYRQSTDQKQIELDESIVTVVRSVPTPPTPSGCKELDWIEERVTYWCKVKLDLSAMYDKAVADAGAKASTNDDAKCQCQCHVTEALREASLEAINKAMHHDIYTAALHAIKLRHCNHGGPAAAEMENAPSTPGQSAKAV